MAAIIVDEREGVTVEVGDNQEGQVGELLVELASSILVARLY